MPTEIVQNRLITEQGREQITLMDDYGTTFHIYVPFVATNRAEIIAAAIAQQNANEAALESYAKSNKIDLTAQKAAGITKKTAAQKGTK